MADIRVIFPENGNPVVNHDGEVVSSGELVTWCFHTDDPRIKFFEVEFAKPEENHFFKEKASEPHKFGRTVVNGRTDFWGHVPAYEGKKRTVIAKYTVRGYDVDDESGKMTEVTAVDPVFITPKP